MWHNIKAKIREFKDDESGVAVIEILLCVPILFWALMSTYLFFDAFRAESISNRAGLTIADMFSREQSAVTPEYVENAMKLFQYLTESVGEAALRVTVYEFDKDADKYLVVWSEHEVSDAYQLASTDEESGPDYDGESFRIKGGLTDADLAKSDIRRQLPRLSDGGTAILLETSVTYYAPFKMILVPFVDTALTSVDFKTFTVIAPRFKPTICMKKTSGADAICRLSDLVP